MKAMWTRARTLLLSLVSMVAGAAGAYTESPTGTFNTDGSQSDVASAVSAMVDGETLLIPSGSFSWSSGVSVSGKGIIIEGAGGGRVEGSSTSSLSVGTGSKSFTIRSGSTIDGFTVSETISARHKHEGDNYMTGTVTSWDGTTLELNVTSTGGSGTHASWTFEAPATSTITHNAGSSALITVTRDASHATEISGLHLIEGTGTGHGIELNGSGKQSLIHDLRISSIHQGIRDTGNQMIAWKCYFDAGFDIGDDTTNNDNGLIITDASGGDAPAWDAVNTVGSNDTDGATNVYIEDCYFIGLVLGCVDAGDFFRGVVRNCVLDNSAITIHGQDTDPEGMRHLEVYDNLMIFDALPEPSAETANLNYWITWRGGSGVVTGNESDDIDSWAWGDKDEISLEYQPLRRNSGPNACYSGSYPAPRQPGQGHNGTGDETEGVYIYSNTGTMVAATSDYSPNECGGGALSITTFVQIDRDYFDEAPAVSTPFYPYTRFTYPHPALGGEASSAGSATATTLTIGP